MEDQKLYFYLFNGITDVVRAMERDAIRGEQDQSLETYIMYLRCLQADAERMYMESE